MEPIKSFSDLLAVQELYKGFKQQGIIEVHDGYMIVTNQLWLTVATEQMIYESEGNDYSGFRFRLSVKNSSLVLLTDVKSKDYAKFLAHIKSKPSLFNKIFNWMVSNS